MLFLAFNRARLVLFGHFEITALAPNMPFLFLVLGIYVIGIAALYQPRIQQHVIEPPDSDPKPVPAPRAESEPETVEQIAPDSLSTEPTAIPETTKYARSGVSIDDAQRYKIRLMESMHDQKLYLDCDLTLRELAEHAGLSYQQASQVINGQMNQRFYSFVNNYRIQLAKDLLADPKTSKMAIADLALEVGFKSKSSFYDAFKKVTEMTPTQYKKRLDLAA